MTISEAEPLLALVRVPYVDPTLILSLLTAGNFAIFCRNLVNGDFGYIAFVEMLRKRARDYVLGQAVFSWKDASRSTLVLNNGTTVTQSSLGRMARSMVENAEKAAHALMWLGLCLFIKLLLQPVKKKLRKMSYKTMQEQR